MLEVIAANRLASISTAIRTLWDPDNCPESFLPFVAWQFKVDRWNPDWSVALKRSVIKASIPAHKIKGTPQAIIDVAAAMGADIELVEWWQVAGTPGTFTLNMTATDAHGDPISTDLQNDIIDAVTVVKRLSQHFTLVLGANAAAMEYLSPFVVAAEFQRIDVQLSGALP